jgi:hypothetical protein
MSYELNKNKQYINYMIINIIVALNMVMCQGKTDWLIHQQYNSTKKYYDLILRRI